MEQVPVVREADTRIVFRSLTDPFDMLTPWPLDDASVRFIDVGPCVAHLPHADPRHPETAEDGFVFFMKEAWRVLAPGSLLTISAPRCTNSYSVADPRGCRFFNEGSFVHFARPSNVETEDWRWDRYGIDNGLRFIQVEIAVDDIHVVASLEKPDAC